MAAGHRALGTRPGHSDAWLGQTHLGILAEASEPSSPSFLLHTPFLFSFSLLPSLSSLKLYKMPFPSPAPTPRNAFPLRSLLCCLHGC